MFRLPLAEMPLRKRPDKERAVAIDGLTTIRSSLGPKDTMDRLEAQVKARGMSVFARIDHAAGAASAD